MTMYIPERFSCQDEESALRLIEDYGFATIVTPVREDCHITHLPLLLDRDEHCLLGHMARANRHHEHLEFNSSTAIFTGPHAYISPNWYPDDTVPTWNYAVVHVQAQASVISDDDELYAIIDRLSRQYESGQPEPWQPKRNQGVEKKLRGIVGFRLPLTSISAKFKMDRNLGAEAVEHVAANLESVPGKDNQELAALMRQQVRWKA